MSLNLTICIKNYANIGGQEGFWRTFIDYLAQHGHTVTILTVKGEASAAGITLRRVKSNRILLRSTRDWMYGKALAADLAATRPALAIGEQKTWNCQVLRPGGGVEDDYWIRRFREWRYPFPLPAFLRLMAPKRFFDLRAERAGYYSPNLRLVLANSRMIAKTLVSYYPHVADRIEVVHNGADDIRFHPDNAKRWRSEIRHELQLDPEGLTAIFAAHDFKLKGLNHAVTALSLVAQRCPEQKLQMIVIGKSRSAAYVRLAGLHGIASAIRFCGSVSQPERYYAAADYLLYPTYYDPCANVVLEALASGLPVITTAQNGASELLTANHDGWIIEQPADTDKLAAHIAELRRPETLARMKSAARRTALQHTLEDKFRRITSLLCELNPVR